MDVTHRQIVDYWSTHQAECGLSVDWAEANKLCWRCAQGRMLQRCHIIPRSLGGADCASNLVLLCGQCHAEAPNVSDPKFMWIWLRAHAVSYYGTYWYLRGVREYELIFGKKPLTNFEESDEILSKINAVISRYIRQTSTHWGQGKLNPSTVAWLLHQVEVEVANDA